jgi:hypothetical protein
MRIVRMSILLFTVGAIAFVAGIVMAGFGIPVGEFSFGNTLISSGTTMAVGGLILIGLAAVVSQLKHIAEVLVAPFPVRPGRPAEAPEAAPATRAPTAAAPAAGRTAFPSRPKPEPALREPEAAEPVLPYAAATHAAERPAELRPSFMPSLRNPDVPPVTLEDEVSLSPHEAVAPAPRDLDEPVQTEPSSDEENVGVSAMRRGPIRETGWRPSPPPVTPVPSRRSTYFDSMWPAEGRSSRGPAVSEPKSDDRPDIPEVASEPAPEFAAEPAPETPPAAAEPEGLGEPGGNEPQRAVAVLKSGVVDGMSYTLYVDGSIEAELPQGTLRFASINELRAHLEKNS